MKSIKDCEVSRTTAPTANAGSASKVQTSRGGEATRGSASVSAGKIIRRGADKSTESSFSAPTPVNSILEQAFSDGQTAGVGPDGAIIVVPRQCVPPGISQVKVLASSRRNKAQRRAIFKQSFLLGLWSQARVGVVMAFSFAMPFLLADYSGAPKVAAASVTARRSAALETTSIHHGLTASNSGTTSASANSASHDGDWLGWKIWGTCRRPQVVFDRASESTIESWGNFSHSVKVAQDKDKLISCVKDVFGTRCNRDAAYATAAENSARKTASGFADYIAQG